MNEIPNIRNLKWPVFTFFILAYVWSWSWWVPVLYKLHDQGNNPGNIPGWIVPFVVLGAYGPSIAAISLTIFAKGTTGLKRLLSRFLLWRAPVLVHFITWLGPSVFLIIAILLSPANSALLGKLDWSQAQLIPMVLISGLIFGPLAEELGWRGYALPFLQKKYSALTSSLIIGVAWCFWHTPLFWAPGGTLISGHEVTILAVSKYLLFACGLSVIFTWIFNRSKGSVLLSVVFHTMANASLPFLLFPYANANAVYSISWLMIIPVWIVAISLLFFYGHRNLSKEPRIKSG
ncbi:MAG: CPBP family intramembrane metalloprotease [Roseivirga sp.]|nr:CPBP family intramembrane metalloprotease [Roseivirga sp.]